MNIKISMIRWNKPNKAFKSIKHSQLTIENQQTKQIKQLIQWKIYRFSFKLSPMRIIKTIRKLNWKSFWTDKSNLVVLNSQNSNKKRLFWLPRAILLTTKLMKLSRWIQPLKTSLFHRDKKKNRELNQIFKQMQVM